LIEEFEEKLEDFQKVAIPLVWVIYPRRRKAIVYRPGKPPVVLREDDELSGEDVIPGFRCPLREILPPRPMAAEPGDAPNGAGPA
jgi:Uma2 family endonuclease